MWMQEMSQAEQIRGQKCREVQSRSRCWPLLAAVLMATSVACTQVRVSVGSVPRAEPCEWVREGQSTRADVLRVFGPPDRIERHRVGEVFSYEFSRRMSRSLTLGDPFVTQLILFGFTRTAELTQRFVVMFDRQGIVENVASALPRPSCSSAD